MHMHVTKMNILKSVSTKCDVSNAKSNVYYVFGFSFNVTWNFPQNKVYIASSSYVIQSFANYVGWMLDALKSKT